VQIDESLRTPYAENWYLGIQQNVTPSFLIEIGHAGSVGRKLVSRDDINRPFPPTRFNSSILDDTFISNAGNSNYLALEIGLRRRFSQGLQYQFSYTYSHAIDNQSDVLEGVRIGPAAGDVAAATFTRQFDARVDRGSANFDQRHNLVFNAIWEVPGGFKTGWPGKALQGWTVSVLGAYRTGFPLTIIVPGSTVTGLRNNRVDFVGSASDRVLLSNPRSITGGVQWLDKQFLRRATDHVGSLGRGALKGPGFWNYDAAILRNFVLKESLRLQFRAEFYNLFNHANLSTPVTNFAAAGFGQALYGLNRIPSRFGDLPLENPARRIQFGVRFQF